MVLSRSLLFDVSTISFRFVFVLFFLNHSQHDVHGVVLVFICLPFSCFGFGGYYC